MTRPLRAGARAVLAATLLLAAGVAAASAPVRDGPAYDLALHLDPATHRLGVVADIDLPESAAGQAVEFILGENFRITASEPALEKLPEPPAQAFLGINGISEELSNRRGIALYRARLPEGVHRLRLEYAGAVDLPPTASAEEYARSFAETPGIIEPKGVYLAGSTLWYPQFTGDQAGALVTYKLTANTPPGWHLIAPGNGVSAGADGQARWETPSAVDEITVAGGPLVPYTAPAGRVQAQVYLREKDPALAAKYLDATNRYLRMYEELLGPYPYTKFALVENFWETGYGMPSYTLLGPQIIRFPFILNSSYPHEILHNWWGNSVYVDYATGNWAEGLTAYLADHLLKEGEGQGAEYRRDVLKKYRDFASTSADFPLRDFRSRHSAATEAVGYGKTLMGMHGLRLQTGDEAFRQGLKTFYRDNRGKRASFADLQAAFTATTGQDYSRYFDELVNRTGAVDLAIEDVRVRQASGRYVVSGVLRQKQAGPYAITVPVVVGTASGPVVAQVQSAAATTPFTVETVAPPQVLLVDPEFDLFRVLDPRETAPSIGQLFGASEVVAVLPGEPAGEAAAWRAMLPAWQSPSRRITIVTDHELKALPADRAVWILGRQNRLAGNLFASAPALGLVVDGTGVRIANENFPFAERSLVLTRRHPDAPALAVGWITASPAAAIPGLGRKLPHYGKYSWLAFAGDEPANVGKGEWPATDSPLVKTLPGAAPDAAVATLAALPRRKPLAEPPAAYSAEALMKHVNYLAAPEREGRGFGSAGLEQAGDYIQQQFAAAGLKPGGDHGGWFQAFSATGGPGNQPATLRNVIGVLPGADPRFRGEAALITAHYDHLGFGWPSPRADAQGKLHPGADDNASGVAVLIEVARQLAAGPPPPRTIVFVAFSGEEAGLLGSRHFVKHPVPVPAAGIFGVVNLDTVGNLRDQPVSVLATGSAREWPFVFSGITAVTGIPTRSIAGASQSSDQQAFIEAGIPGVQLFTAATADYHRPSDTPDKVDGPGMAKVAAVATEAISYLASTDKRLAATAPGASGAAEPAGPGTGPTRRVSLGAVPDFAFQGPGLRLESVVPGSPAEKAGLKPGDVITSLGGAEVRDLGSFNEQLRKYAPGDEVEVAWTRGGASHRAKVKLAAR